MIHNAFKPAFSYKTMKKGPLEDRLSDMFKIYGWRIFIKLESRETKCCENARQKAIDYLISCNYMSYSPKGHHRLAPLDDPEPIIDSKGKEAYFVKETDARSYGIAKYGTKNKKDPNYGKLPSGIFTPQVEPAAT